MFYDKKIKYLDYCENGERICGGGFVKTEIKERDFKLYLSVRGLRFGGTVAAKVVLCGKEEESVLGQMTLENGQGEFRHECQMEGEEIPLSYEEITGIRVLLGEKHELKCIWKNEAVAEGQRRTESEPKTADAKKESPKKTKEEKAKEEKPNEESTARSKQEKTEKPNVEKLKAERPNAERPNAQRPNAERSNAQGSNAQRPNAERPNAERPNAEESNAHRANDEGLNTQRPNAARSNAEQMLSAENESEAQKISAAEERLEEQLTATENRRTGQPSAAKSRKEVEVISAMKSRREAGQPSAGEKQGSRIIPLLEDKWNQICAIYPHVKPFQDEREYLSIGPADFVMFTAASYRAANNSFLLHGYYNYKHLILTRVEQRGEILYYLGVPGNYYAREKQVAVIFGFESFECAEEPAQDGDFGYYLMKVQL